MWLKYHSWHTILINHLFVCLIQNYDWNNIRHQFHFLWKSLLHPVFWKYHICGSTLLCAGSYKVMLEESTPVYIHHCIGVAWVFFLVRQLGECSEGGNARGVRNFPEFKWIIYDFSNNRINTQKTISICA
jgi:hypothetical protein